MDKKIFALGSLWILLGIIVCLLSQLAFGVKWTNLATTFFMQLGLSFILLGIVAIIIQLKNWKNYFQERLKDVVIQSSYLNNLNEEELANLQIAILKSKFKGTDIDREGSFLQHFQRRIQSFIGSPYRENVTASIAIKENRENDNCYVVNDVTSYTCRSLGRKIQEDVQWLYTKDEFVEVRGVKLTLKCDSDGNAACKANCKIDECKDGKVVLSEEKLKAYYHDGDIIEGDKYCGYIIPLKDIIEPSDKLEIILNTEYLIDKERMFTWAMTHLSKDVTFTISYPEKYSVNLFVGGARSDEYHFEDSGNMKIFRHDGWFLPNTGLSYQLTKNKPAKEQSQ